MTRIYISVLFLSGCLSGSGVAGAGAGALRIALLDHARVRGDAILLAYLLPLEAPRALRDAAEKISLGPAPQNGLARTISRSAVEASLADTGLWSAQFVVPESMTIARAARPVSRAEVYAAIQDFLAGNKMAAAPVFSIEDLSLEAQVFVPDGLLQLEVTQVVFDQFIGRVRFRLRPRSAAGVLPFFATAAIPASPASLHLDHASAAAPNLAWAPGAPRVAPVLVEAGHLAKLHLHSRNAEMLLEVRALQRGHLGDTIRVRLPASGKTFRARVIGREFLEAVF